MAEASDLTALLAKVAAGDRAALRSIHVRYASRLYGIALAILRERMVAADVLQEALVTVWSRAREFVPGRLSAEAWLAGIVRHAALAAARARGREMPGEDFAEAAIDPEALDGLMASADGLSLRDTLSRMEKSERAVVVMAYVHGLSQAELATALGFRLAAVRPVLRRGLAALRERLG